MLVAMLFLAYRSGFDDFQNGGLATRVALVGACLALAALAVWLYVRSGLLVFEIADEGLVIRRLHQRTVVSWHTIREVRWNQGLKFVSIHGDSGLIAFVSTHAFPQCLVLITMIHDMSGCKVPDALRERWR